MCGGEKEALERARPVLEQMGKKITHFGPSGAGQNAKLTNQIMVANNLMGVCEAFAFAQKNGLDLTQVHSALTGGAANSWALDVLGGKILLDDYDPTFMVKLQTKDLRLVLNAASESKVAVPGTSLSNQMLTTVEAEGRGDDGTQSLVRTYRKMAGMKETTK
jgi:3-hydroxyisobutyrate dehydrogenase